jgi:hypothetical protein
MQHLAEWTARMLDASEATAAKIGCSPAAIVAQAALETGWGASAIGNNVFGIKADVGWQGARRLAQTWEHISGADVPMECWFRDYPTLADGIEDHFEFLCRNARYANVFDKGNYLSDEDYLTRLAQDGYATAPNYAGQLIAVLATVRAIEGHLVVDGFPPQPLPPRILLVGCSGPDVAKLQSILMLLAGYRGKIDGDFGPMTYAAVCTFQRDHNLEADGIVGPKTRAMMVL